MRKRQWLGLAAALALVGAIAYPVYAHCGKCVESAKEFLKAMKDGKVTLASAISTAEGAGKGTAVAAVPHKHADGAIHVHVYTLDGDKMTLVMVDTRTGKVVKTEDARMIEGDAHGHDHKDDKKKP